jgi:Zn-dependent protease
MVLNLLPLPPLDGGRIAVSLLPNHLAYKFAQIERYGFIILIVLLATGVLSSIMEPLIRAVINMIVFIF